jgi:stage V sporulation protein R
MRKFRMFQLSDRASDRFCEIRSIHNERGYSAVRSALARNYDLATNKPDIQVVDVDLLGDRQLRLRHTVKDGMLLDDKTRDATLAHIRRLWGYDVSLAGVEASGEAVLYECSTADAG